MGQVVEVFTIQRAGYDGADALVGIFGGSGGYADQEFFDGGIFDVLSFAWLRYGGSVTGQIVSLPE